MFQPHVQTSLPLLAQIHNTKFFCKEAGTSVSSTPSFAIIGRHVWPHNAMYAVSMFQGVFFVGPPGVRCADKAHLASQIPSLDRELVNHAEVRGDNL